MSLESDDVASLRSRCEALEREVERLRSSVFEPSEPRVVKVPDEIQPLFDRVAATMRDVFRRIDIDPARARIAIDDERYVLIRASALSIDFFDTVVELYADRGEREALAIARGFLFDIAHTIGIHDARMMSDKLGAGDPLERLTAGPAHFAFTGWASVDIKPASRPVANRDFCLVYEHPYSFEAASFLRAGRRTEGPACIMNSGYSSGWCEAAFGLELTAVEVKCRARGDGGCFFVMAPPDRLAEHVKTHFDVDLAVLRARGFDVPTYFERKRAEEEVRRSLERVEAAQAELVRKERLATVGLLVAGVAHDVNTPLGVAVTAGGIVDEELATLRRRFDDGTLSKSDFEAFFDRASQASALVATNLARAAEQIARFKQVAVDHATYDRRKVDLGAYVRETIDSLRPIAKSSRLDVTVETFGYLTCVTHPGAVAQIVTNLLANTAAHGHGEAPEAASNGRRIAVKVAVEKRGEAVVLRYEDDGAGMSDEVRERAFQAFYTTRRGAGGSGLGLHVVHSIVSNVLGGSIELTSAEGAGTRFRIVWGVPQTLS